MKKTLKIAGIAVAAVIGLIVIAAVALLLVFDPNQYKPQIVQLVKDQTGRELKIGKKIGWSFFPRLGIEAGGLELSNAPGFGKEPFAKVDAAGVHVAVLPLFGGRIEIGRVYLHGLELNLAKNPAGRNNWDDLTAGKPVPAPGKPEAPASGKLPIEGLAVGGLEVRRSNLVWHDRQAGSRMAVRNLELTTGRFVANQPMDLKLGFELARDRAAPVKAALASRLTVSTDAFKLDKVDLKLDDSRLQGSIDVRNLASPALRFDLALDRIDLDRYLGGKADTAKPAAPDRAPSPAQPAGTPLAALRGLDVDGKFQIGALKAFGLHTSEAKIRIHARNGLIRLGPNSARLYQGSYRGETSLDARGRTLQLTMNEKLEGVQVGPLLKDAQLFDNYTGTGNITLKLTAAGFDAAQIRKTLNGNAGIALRDGSIEGVDLLKLIEQARALYDLAKGKPVTVSSAPGDATVFRSLTANILVTHGIARNDDLVLDGANLRATGRGSADLVRETLDYKLKVTVAESADRRGTTVPVLIGGTFARPTYGVDFGEILKQQAEKELKKQLEKGLEQLLQPKKRK